MSIEIRKVSKRFGQFEALKDVDLVIPDGEVLKNQPRSGPKTRLKPSV